MKNLHVPLPEELHQGLLAESKRVRRPATALARHREIAAFAEQHADTDLDLDSDLEQASLEHLAETETKR